jgi:excisionase family DNA binding protein
MEEKQYMTLDQAAKILCVSRQTLTKWIKKGLMPAQQLPGGAYRLTQSDLHECFRQKAAQSLSKPPK